MQSLQTPAWLLRCAPPSATQPLNKSHRRYHGTAGAVRGGALSPCVDVLSLYHVLVYLRQTKQVVVAVAAAEWTRLDKLPHGQRGSGRGGGTSDAR